MAKFCLHQLCQHPSIEVKGVITKADAARKRHSRQQTPVKDLAQVQSLPVWTPDDLKDSVFLSQVLGAQAKWAIVLAYGKILPKNFLSLFPKRALNFHASLLPRWRGAAPVQRAIMAGDKKLGMTLQVIAPRLDTGDIVASKSFALPEEQDALFAFQKMEECVKKLLPNLMSYMKGECFAQAQDLSPAMYAHKVQKQESWIKWSDSETKIINQIRALVTGPAAYTLYRGKRLKILKARRFALSSSYQQQKTDLSAGKQSSSPAGESLEGGASASSLGRWDPGQPPALFHPGEVIDIGLHDFTAACGKEGGIQVTQVQAESRKPMLVTEYLRGSSLKKGDILGE